MEMYKIASNLTDEKLTALGQLLGNLDKTKSVSPSRQAARLNTAIAMSIWGGRRQHKWAQREIKKPFILAYQKLTALGQLLGGLDKTKSLSPSWKTVCLNTPIAMSICGGGSKHMWAKFYLHEHQIWHTKTHCSWLGEGRLDDNKSISRSRHATCLKTAIALSIWSCGGGQDLWAMACADQSTTRLGREWQKSLTNG